MCEETKNWTSSSSLVLNSEFEVNFQASKHQRSVCSSNQTFNESKWTTTNTTSDRKTSRYESFLLRCVRWPVGAQSALQPWAWPSDRKEIWQILFSSFSTENSGFAELKLKTVPSDTATCHFLSHFLSHLYVEQHTQVCVCLSYAHWTDLFIDLTHLMVLVIDVRQCFPVELADSGLFQKHTELCDELSWDRKLQKCDQSWWKSYKNETLVVKSADLLLFSLSEVKICSCFSSFVCRLKVSDGNLEKGAKSWTLLSCFHETNHPSSSDLMFEAPVGRQHQTWNKN